MDASLHRSRELQSQHKPDLVMCRPTYFGVQYVINPWMQGQIGRVDHEQAMRQWDGLYNIISERAKVSVIDGVEGLPDMCFAANAGLIVDNKFIPSRFRFPQRAPEVPIFIDWFREQGYDIVPFEGDDNFEGEGDALLAPKLSASDTPTVSSNSVVLWAGYGVRSDLETHQQLSQLLNIDVVSLRLVDERFYHLDTCFYPLPGNRVVYYPAAFDRESVETISKRVPPENRIEVHENDALRFTCNTVRIGHTLITNHASEELQARLTQWGYEVLTTPLDQFMLAGGAAKCLCLIGRQNTDTTRDENVQSPIRQTHVSVAGHLLDSGLMNRLFDTITDGGGSFNVEQFAVGQRRDQPSTADVRVAARNQNELDLIVNRLQELGATVAAGPVDANLQEVEQNGVAPQEFYSTTIYPTDVRIHGKWERSKHQRMDAVLVVENDDGGYSVRCSLIRDLVPGDKIVCGNEGVRVHRPPIRGERAEFSFMSSGVSSERRVELVVEELAWEMKRIRAREGRIVVVAGPVVIHTGGGQYLSEIIEAGFVQALLTGNALPTHDIEMNIFGTSLGVNLARGIGVHGGHQHHIKAINLVRAAGSIREAVEQGLITGGVMHSCVKHNVEYVLAGSIRDDGPLPDTLMDLYDAQAAYAKVVEDADMILMLSTMLHAIGTGNMTKAGVRMVCVDISPAVVTKLADRGSIESTGIVTDVGLFLNLLARQLRE